MFSYQVVVLPWLLSKVIVYLYTRTYFPLPYVYVFVFKEKKNVVVALI